MLKFYNKLSLMLRETIWFYRGKLNDPFGKVNTTPFKIIIPVFVKILKKDAEILIIKYPCYFEQLFDFAEENWMTHLVMWTPVLSTLIHLSKHLSGTGLLKNLDNWHFVKFCNFFYSNCHDCQYYWDFFTLWIFLFLYLLLSKSTKYFFRNRDYV